MGVDCRIVLPPAARLRDVADVLGRLSGLAIEKMELGSGHGYAAHVSNGLKVSAFSSGSALVECANLEIEAPNGETLVDGEPNHRVMYHFEGGKNGERLLMPRSTPFWIAVAHGLVDFFGGSINYQDCTDEIGYHKRMRNDIHAEDGDEWQSLQDRKLAVMPITSAQLKSATKKAAYA